MKKLALLRQENFGDVTCNLYKNQNNNILMTREQIGMALEYKDPMVAIAKIHTRYSERLDKFSFTKLVNGRDTYFYTSKGIYEICRWSRQPKADAFMDWVWDTIDNLQEFLRVKQTLEWQEARKSNKSENKQLNDMVKLFVEHAITQGSTNYKNYYNSFQNLINKVCGIEKGQRDNLTQKQLYQQIIIMNFLEKEIQEGINKQLKYKEIYKLCKEKATHFVACFNLQLKS